MLGKFNVSVSLAVKDLAVAEKFYGETLGLEKAMDVPGGMFYKSGAYGVFIYASSYAGTNQADYANWMVDDVPTTIEELKTKGVTFEHYDLEGVTRDGDVHTAGNLTVAWFKDPDGNILNIWTRS